MGYLPYQLVQDFFHQQYDVHFIIVPKVDGEKLPYFPRAGDTLQPSRGSFWDPKDVMYQVPLAAASPSSSS